MSQIEGPISKLIGHGWESSGQGFQLSDQAQTSSLEGVEQYSAGAGPYLNIDIRYLISGAAHGNMTLDQEIRPLISGVSYAGSFLDLEISGESQFDLRDLFTHQINGNNEGSGPVPVPDGFASSTGADDGLLDLQIPTLTLGAFSGGQVDGQLPVPFITASGTVPGIGRLDIQFGANDGNEVPYLTITTAGTAGEVGTLDLEFMRYFTSFGQTGWPMYLPPFFNMSIEATGTAAGSGRLDKRIPRISINASGTVGGSGILDEVIPPIFMVQSATLTSLVPPIRLVASGGEIVPPQIVGYAVNVKLAAMTKYNHWPFTHVVRFRDQYVGVNTAGAFVLGAPDVDGTPFNFEFTLPKIDFGVTSLKRLVHFHGTQRNSGKVRITTTPDEGTGILYELDGLSDPGIRTRRKKLMKGPRARYWTVKVEGLEGEPFDLDDIELRAQIIHGRRIR